MGDGRIGDPLRVSEPARVEGGLVEGEAGVAEGAVVLQETVHVDAPAREDPHEAVAAPHGVEQEARRPGRGPGVVGSPQCGPRFGQRADREAVPRGEHLVVAERFGARGTPGLQRGQGLRQHPVQLRARHSLPAGDRVRIVGQVENVPPLEVPGVAHVVDPRQETGGVRAQNVPHLGGCPQVEGALLALGVGVAGRSEDALRRRKVLEHVVERLSRQRAPGGAPRAGAPW